MTPFRIQFSKNIFDYKYKHEKANTWEELSETLILDVCKGYLPQHEIEELIKFHSEMKFIAGGRYLYYAGRENKFFNNCFLLKACADNREDWANLSWKAESCLMTGGGIGVDYSIYRAKGTPIKKTGGLASGTISKMEMINSIGRKVMQGGSRRSAIYASLNWKHDDSTEFLTCKDWYNIPVKGAYDKNGKPLMIGDLKEADFNYEAPLDMTNVSLNYDNEFLEEIYQIPFDKLLSIYKEKGSKGIFNLDIKHLPETFVKNCYQALKTGEPGMSFNFFEKVLETLRNACCEVTSEDDSDVCNLGSVNLSRIETIEEFERICYLASKFLYLGTLKADLPYQKVHEIRAKNRRLGLGLMGMHEWLLQRGYQYEVTEELHKWLGEYVINSEKGANELAKMLRMSKPVAYRAIAPTGTIGIMAGTTTGIEPLFAVAYKRRYLKGESDWCYEYVIDGTAKLLIEKYGVDPKNIETSLSLSQNPEKRIKFQADVQDYVDMAISSTINLPAWGSEYNNESTVEDFAKTLAKYAIRLRGFTCYPDGARGGQPLTIVDYEEAFGKEGIEMKEEYFDVCDLTKGGTCGV
jgi:ribonucleoside-diphosphate reductase alpha chain